MKQLAGDERRATVALLTALIEFDRRKLYLREGASSLFVYCTTVLHLGEHAAINRIEAARAAARWPAILAQLAAGALNLSTVRLLAPHLTDANVEGLIRDAAYKSKRRVEEIVAVLRPRADVPSTVRKLPVKAHAPATRQPLGDMVATVDATPPTTTVPIVTNAPPAFRVAVLARPAVTPLAPERFKVQFTFGRESHDRLRRIQDLMRHAVPNGDLAAIFDRALVLLLADLEKRKLARTEHPKRAPAPRDGSRHIPAAVKREVWRRDAGQCAFVGHAGRCAERGFLEFHHVFPFVDRGAATVENIQLRCRAHNAYEASLLFPASPDEDPDSPRGE